jgi:manganese transport protein
VAIALDFSGNDEKLLAESLRFIDKAKTRVVLLHVVESPVARTLGAESEDLETLSDREHLEKLAETLRKAGVSTQWRLASGDPVSGLAKMINELNTEIVIVGSHGHSGVSDLLHGSVINDLRHHVKASVMIVPLGA